MSTTYRHIQLRREGDVYCVFLKKHQLDDMAIRAMSDEVESMIDREQCRKLVLCLGEITCLYSVLIAKLIKLRRTMSQRGGALRICDVTPEVMEVFESCHLHTFFDFTTDKATAVASFAQP